MSGSGAHVPHTQQHRFPSEHRPDLQTSARSRPIPTTPSAAPGAATTALKLSLFGDRSPEFHAAGERYRDDNAIAVKAGVRLADAPVVRFRGHTSGGPSDAILDALERVAAASHAMGRTAMPASSSGSSSSAISP